MKFATYEVSGNEESGVLIADRLYPLTHNLLFHLKEGLQPLLAEGSAAQARGISHALTEVKLKSPIKPPTIRDFVGFEAHVEGVVKNMDGLAETPSAWYPRAQFYFTNPNAITGPFDDVEFPPLCRILDFECEVGAVLGISGSNLSPSQSHDGIIGYTIFNDWSARDLQKQERELGLGFAKGKDFANTFGPYLVTADEFEVDDEGFIDITMSVEINGELVGQDSLASVSWNFGEMISYASRGTWVHPGDIFGSGTCGSGCLSEMWGRAGQQTPPPLKPGDVVTMTVEGIGTISNKVVASTAIIHEIPPARKRQRGVRH